MSSFWASFPRISEGLERIKARLVRQAELLPADLRDELTPLLRREGKFLRAGLLLLSSDPASSTSEAVEAAAGNG